MADDSHFKGGVATGLPKYEDKGTKGPVPMHHRLKLGHLDAAHDNPYGTGRPSTESKIANDQRKTW